MEFKDLLEIAKSGGAPLILALIWIAYRTGKLAQQATGLLEEIRDHLKTGREEIKIAAARQETKLTALHDDVTSLPLEIYRANKR